jgi:hypothetical protein
VQIGELFPGLGHLYKCLSVIRLGRQLQRLLAAILSTFSIFSYVAHCATACAFRFLRQPSRPKPPMPVANSGRAAGSGRKYLFAQSEQFNTGTSIRLCSELGFNEAPAH